MTGVLRTVTPRTSDTHTYRFDVRMSYRPGQAIALILPNDPKKRYFSLSSSPTEAGHIEITVKTEPASALAQSLATLKRGDSVTIEGPMGSFGLPDTLDQPLCFISAGSGIAPFRSMIKFLLDNSAGKDLWLLHSVKTPADLMFREEMQLWSGTHKRFRYIPTITRDFDDDWKNETGRITETLLRKHLPKTGCTYLLCGPPAFVTDMEKLLRETLKVPAESIRREQW